MAIAKVPGGDLYYEELGDGFPAGHAIAFDAPAGLVKMIVEALMSYGGASDGSLRA